MFRKIKGLFSGREPEDVLKIRPGEIPGLLTSHEKEWEEEYAASVAESRKKILGIRDHLIRAVRDINHGERETAFHPKLEKIARNSLPQFEKAFLSALNRELPESPDAFYAACTESLKGCVKGLAGPGRYLKTVLPEEMKAVRVLVDDFGREINALTPRVAEWRKKKDEGAVLRDTFARIREMESSLENLSRELPARDAEIGDIRQVLDQYAREKDGIEKSLAADQTYKESISGVTQSEQECEEAGREAHAVLSTLAHVFRKAEKIAHRPGMEKLAKELNQATSLLSQRNIPPEDEVVATLNAVLPVIRSMIQSGEIQLKNQEERALFARPEEIPGDVSALIKKWVQSEERVEVMRGRIAGYPPLIRLAQVEGDQKSCAAELREKEKRRDDMEHNRQEILEGLPLHYHRLEQQLSATLGQDVRIITH